MSWTSRLRNAIHSKRLDADLAEEMADHIARRTEEFIAAGMSQREAEARAHHTYGNMLRLFEQSREARLWRACETVIQDVTYAWRGMRKTPAFAITAIVSLSLAIGANTAIFSILDAALLKPLPLPHPEQLIVFATPDIEQPGIPAGPGERDAFSFPLYRQFRQASAGLAQLALVSYSNRIEVREKPNGPILRATQQWISADTFQILQAPLAFGRLFSPEMDGAPGTSPYAVISYRYWRDHYNYDPNILHQTLLVEGKQYQIIGVAGKGFFGIEPGKQVDVWLPANMYNKEAFNNPGWSWFRIMGRRLSGVTQARIQSRLQPVLHSAMASMVERNPTMPPAIRQQFLQMQLRVHEGFNGPSNFRRDFKRPLWIVFGVATGILLIACANVASLLLARSSARASEFSLRLSLGAPRSRLLRQLLTESLVLASLAGLFGWLLARESAPTLLSFLSTENEPVQLVLSIDTRVLLFCAMLSAVSTAFFGILPAWQAAGVQPVVALRQSSGQAGRLRFGRLFVGLQVAFAFCLVIAGATFLFTLRNLLAVNPGFDPAHVTVLNLVDDVEPEAGRLALMNRFQNRIASVPGVQSAALAAWSIFDGSFWTEQVLVPGHHPSEREEIFYNVSPGYFRTLRTPLLAGREFDNRDSATHQPIPTIVSQNFARTYLPEGVPLGRHFQNPDQKRAVDHVVVGVVADAIYSNLKTRPDPLVYVPLPGRNDFAVYIRSSLPDGAVVRNAQREVSAIGGGLRVYRITKLDTLIGNTILKEKLLAGIAGVFGALGLALAAIGIFGLLNYSVGCRTRELGIRGALGAHRRELVFLIFRDLFGMLGGGLLAGLAFSFAILSALRSLFFGVRVVDPEVLVVAVAVFLVAAAIAAGIPAGRAASVDPMVALRNQ